jgi:hypothetical protein
MIRKRSTLLSVVILMLTAFAWSQTQSGTVTLKGTVSEATLLSNNDLHVWLQNGSSGSEVCLGSADFLDTQGVLPRVGDNVEVTGIRVGNGSLLAATSLEMGGKTVMLRRGPASSPTRPDCPNCGGYQCGHHGCGYDHHGCNHHHGHCCDDD